MKLGAILERKIKGENVTSPWAKGFSQINGNVEVLMAPENIGWMSASHLK